MITGMVAVAFFAVLALCYEVPLWIEAARGARQQKRGGAV